MSLTIADVVRATGADVLRSGREGLTEGGLAVADLERELGAVRIDSREIQRSDLFVALKGENTDGHEFIGAAVRAGARGCLVSKHACDDSLLNGVAFEQRFDHAYVFGVDDPLAALQQLARYWRQKHDVKVVGITGSVGKTTTKEIVAAILSTKFRVLKNEQNLNTEIGLPLTLLRLQGGHEVAVLEMGMYAPGDIKLLARLSEPEVGIVTNVAPVHLQRLGSIELIAKTKSELIASLPPDGLAVLNADDPWTRAMAISSGVAPVVLVGFGEDSDYQVTDLTSHGLDGMTFRLRAEGQKIELRTRLAGAHFVQGLVMGAAVAWRLGMSWDEIREAVASVEIDVRQKLIRVSANVVVIDDAYNASPPSVHAALSVLSEAPGTKVAVLGDMLELGPITEEAHREIGRHAASVADWLVVRGPQARWIAEEARQNGIAEDRIIQPDTNLEAVEAVKTIVAGLDQPGQDVARTVLVKGSRGMQMEEIVQGLAEMGD